MLQVNQSVRVNHPIPNFNIPDGAVGVVCSQWFEPQVAYEVEFRTPGLLDARRVLLREQDIERIEEAEETPQA